MKKTAILFSILTLFASCKKDDRPLPPSAVANYTNGLVVLNEGLYQQNNSSLCFYSFENNQVFTQAFFTENGRGLGDTANDFEKYTLDGKEYIIIAVDISSQIEIVEANTLKAVAQIPLFDGASAREPRRIDVYGYAAFVCSFDGTVSVIDLTSYEVVKTIQVGANPDGMVQVGNELFVSNSGGLNFPIYDSTISVIDMTTREVTHTMDARINCTKMIVDSQNEIYVLSNGNYGSVPSALIRVDAVNHALISETEISITSMTQVGDWIYYYDDVLKSVRKFNMLTEQFETGSLIDCSSYETFSGMQFVPELNLLFCFDAKGYVNSSVVRAYNLSGVLQYEFSTELNTKKIIFNE
jgi:YVTN family beta-propeller protein